MGAAAVELGGSGGDLGGKGVGAAAAELVGCGRARRRQSRTQARAGTALRGVGGKDVSRPSRLWRIVERTCAGAVPVFQIGGSFVLFFFEAWV